MLEPQDLSPTKLTFLNPSNTVFQNLDVFLILGDQLPEPFVVWLHPKLLGPTSEILLLPVQAAPESELWVEFSSSATTSSEVGRELTPLAVEVAPSW